MKHEKPEMPDYEPISVEKLKALYHADERLTAPYQLYRLNSKGGHIYFKEGENGSYTLFLGITTVGALLPKAKPLLYWIADKGVDEAELYMNQKGTYGSFFHTLIADYFIFGELNLTELPDRVRAYLFEHQIPLTLAEKWCVEMQSDILAFIQWVLDYEVEPLVVEMPLCSESLGVGTLIDFVGWMNKYNYQTEPRIAVATFTKKVRKPIPEFGIEVGESCWRWKTVTGEMCSKTEPTQEELTQKRERVLAIVDFKSGKKGSFPSYRIQLQACKDIFQENFPDFPEIEKFYNLSPKDFTGSQPTYTLTDQTDKLNPNKYVAYIEIAKEEKKEIITRPMRVISGTIKKGDTPSDFILDKTIQELIEENHWQKFVQEEKKEPPKLNMAEFTNGLQKTESV